MHVHMCLERVRVCLNFIQNCTLKWLPSSLTDGITTDEQGVSIQHAPQLHMVVVVLF